MTLDGNTVSGVAAILFQQILRNRPKLFLNIVWFVFKPHHYYKEDLQVFAVSYLTIVYMISVVTAYYNSHDFIGKAFESLKAQSHECWEWIIVDDGSKT